jgi:hypothetical protein
VDRVRQIFSITVNNTIRTHKYITVVVALVAAELVVVIVVVVVVRTKLKLTALLSNQESVRSDTTHLFVP